MSVFQPNVRDKLSPLEVQMRYDISSKKDSTEETSKEAGTLIPVSLFFYKTIMIKTSYKIAECIFGFSLKLIRYIKL